ncbi:MAG: choice-of-anchor V domain-containing protein [Bacteroidota bacterium]
MKIHYLPVILLASLVVGMTHTLISYSDGPPVARTGAPGDLTCYNGYCHNDFLLGSGPGEIALFTDIPESGYVPGQTYLIQPKVKQTGQSYFGFMSMAFSATTNGSIGQLKEAEDARTQFKWKFDSTRHYVTHDTAYAAQDSAMWAFLWQAPDSGSGEVSFYTTFVAANGNGNRGGDYVYKDSWTFSEGQGNATSMEAALSLQGFSAWVPYGQTEIVLQWNGGGQRGTIELELWDLQGKLLGKKQMEATPATYQLRWGEPGYSNGIYLLRAALNGQTYSRKVYLH